MSEVSREELTARLETIEARMDGRIASIEGKFDLMFHRLDQLADTATAQRDETRESIKEIKNDTRSISSSLKFWVAGAIISVIGTGIAIQQMTVSTFQAAAAMTQAPVKPAPVTPTSNQPAQ